MTKESIRKAYNSLADFYFQIGNLQEALKTYSRTRDFCSTPKHNIETCFNVIATSIIINNYQCIPSQLSRAESFAANDVVTKSKCKIISALLAVNNQQFITAARYFLEADGDIGQDLNRVISPEDIAVYGTILGIATLDRQELRKLLLENGKFNTCFADLVPEMRAIVRDFFSSNFVAFFEQLRHRKSLLLVDIYLHKYTELLYEMIQDKIIIQFVIPYNTVSMVQMAQSLGMTLEELEHPLSRLISQQKIPARIDSLTKTIHRNRHDDRMIAREKVLQISKNHIHDLRSAILGLSLQKYGFSVGKNESNTSTSTKLPKRMMDHSSSSHLPRNTPTTVPVAASTLFSVSDPFINYTDSDMNSPPMISAASTPPLGGGEEPAVVVPVPPLPDSPRHGPSTDDDDDNEDFDDCMQVDNNA